MKKILCFGDSNTFGFNPENGKRYEENKRWSGIFKKTLKNSLVIEKGCNNRSCFNNQGELNSLEIIDKYLTSDLTHIILQIGINDLQFQYNTDLDIFKNNLEMLIKKINTNTKVILLCPNTIGEQISNSFFKSLFNKTSIEKSKKLPEIYKNISENFNCTFINLNNIASTSYIDGLHYDIENHNKIAQILIETLE